MTFGGLNLQGCASRRRFCPPNFYDNFLDARVNDVVKEELGMRSMCGKVYRRARTSQLLTNQNRYHSIYRLHPVHYPDTEPGIWHNIDLNPRKNGSVIQVNKTWYDARLDGTMLRYKSKRGGSTSVLDFLGENDRVIPRILGNRVVYDNIRLDTDLIFEFRPMSIIALKVLKSERANKTFQWYFKNKGQEVTNFNFGRRAWDSGKNTEGTPRHAKVDIKLINDNTIEEIFTGMTFNRTLKNRFPEISNEVKYPVYLNQDITENIVANNDDGMVYADYGFYGTGYNNVYQTSQYDGVTRFQGIAVGQGDTIDSGTQLTVIATAAETFTGTLAMHDIGDAPENASANVPISPLTTATTALNETSTGSMSWDAQAMFQEVVNLGTWASGQDARFAINWTSGTLWFTDYNDSPANSADFEINFTAAGGNGGYSGAQVI